jgi:hypothetical protein
LSFDGCDLGVEDGSILVMDGYLVQFTGSANLSQEYLNLANL